MQQRHHYSKKKIPIAVCQITLKTQHTNHLNGYYVNAVITIFSIMDANFCMKQKYFQNITQIKIKFLPIFISHTLDRQK